MMVDSRLNKLRVMFPSDHHAEIVQRSLTEEAASHCVAWINTYMEQLNILFHMMDELHPRKRCDKS